MIMDRFWHRPINLVSLVLLVVTIFVPLVYTQGQISVSVWQLIFLLLMPALVIKANLAGDNGYIFWLSVSILMIVVILQPIVIGMNDLIFKSWLLYISQLMVFVLLALGFTKFQLFQVFSRFVAISAFLVAIIMIIQFVTSSTIGNPRSYFGAENPASFWRFQGFEFVRPLGTLDNPNISGAFLLVSLPFIIHAYEMTKKPILVMSVLLIMVAIIMTMSRGIIAGLFVLMLSFFWGRYSWLLKRLVASRLGLFTCIIIFPGLFMFFFIAGYWEPIVVRFESLFISSVDDEHLNRGTADFRFLMIWIGILAGLEHPFFGVGLGGSAYILSDYTSLIPEWWQHRIHAFTPAMFAEAGALSGIIWLLLQLTALFRAFKSIQNFGSYARAIFSVNFVTFYLSWFYTTLYTVEFGAIYFIILLLGIKSNYTKKQKI